MENEYAILNAQAWMQTITDYYNADGLLADGAESVEVDGMTFCDSDTLWDTVLNTPLDVSVRSAWASVGTEFEVDEYQVLLSTGGPSLRIHGDLDSCGRAVNARLEWQDRGTGWRDEGVDINEDALDWFVEMFYFVD